MKTLTNLLTNIKAIYRVITFKLPNRKNENTYEEYTEPNFQIFYKSGYHTTEYLKPTETQLRLKAEKLIRNNPNVDHIIIKTNTRLITMYRNGTVDIWENGTHKTYSYNAIV